MSPQSSASMLYNVVECPHRPTMDLSANPAERDARSPFLTLLWKHGVNKAGRRINIPAQEAGAA